MKYLGWRGVRFRTRFKFLVKRLYRVILYAACMASMHVTMDSAGKRKNAYGRVILFMPKSPNRAISAAYVKGLANAIVLIGSGTSSNG